LIAQRLEFGFGFGLDRVAGFINLRGELVQILVKFGQLALHLSTNSVFCAKV